MLQGIEATPELLRLLHDRRKRWQIEEGLRMERDRAEARKEARKEMRRAKQIAKAKRMRAKTARARAVTRAAALLKKYGHSVSYKA